MRRRAFIRGLVGLIASAPSARAQQSSRVYRLAIVHPSAPVTELTDNSKSGPAYPTFFSELRRLGYVEGKNLRVDRYSGEGRVDQYGEVARMAVQRNPDVIWTQSSRLVQHMKAATSVIPIVGFMADPVGFQLVTSLSRPSGNVTGITSDVGLDVASKRLELLKEAIPGMSRVGFLISSELTKGHVVEVIREAAHKLGILLVGPPLASPIDQAEYRHVFLAMSEEHADALLMSDQPEHASNRQLIAMLAEQYRLPTIGPSRPYAEAGALASYGINVVDVFRIGATQMDQILKGAFPGDLPIQQPTKFELVVNLKSAKALGLTIPPALLARADELIE